MSTPNLLIHFPIALFLVSFAFDLLALWRDNRQLAIAAYYNLVARGDRHSAGGSSGSGDCGRSLENYAARIRPISFKLAKGYALDIPGKQKQARVRR